jgi:uncharacterized protein
MTRSSRSLTHSRHSLLARLLLMLQISIAAQAQSPAQPPAATANLKPPGSATASAPAFSPSSVRQLDWDALLPKDERDNFNTAPPPPKHSYLGGEGGMAAMQEGSFAANLDLNNKSIKIPGFVVPLDILPTGYVREFYLVPYFGACIHVPPPPPNQIVYVKMAAPVKAGSMYDAVWISGMLRTEAKTSRFGAAAYTLEGVKVEPYKY